MANLARAGTAGRARSPMTDSIRLAYLTLCCRRLLRNLAADAGQFVIADFFSLIGQMAGVGDSSRKDFFYAC